MGRLLIKAAACSDIGLSRTNNEDNYYLDGAYIKAEDDSQTSCAFISPQQNGVFAVFDGMGGQSRGEFASLCAAQTLQKFQSEILSEGTKKVNEYIKTANDTICTEMSKTNEIIGSTMVLLTINNNEAQVYNLGDSRAYYVTKGRIYQLSRDHTVAEQLYQLKMLTKEQANKDIRKNNLTKHLGVFQNEIDLRAFASGNIKMKSGDTFLLCSDGVTSVMTDKDLRTLIVNSGDKCKKLAGQIVELAIRSGSKDNVTAIVVKAAHTFNSKQKRRKWGKHPRLYPFLLGVGISVLAFSIVVSFILYHFMK
ncbi:serine/threonine protein phosphatase [Clostridia bacterium]|nr:serine/threonine protein phosphatase [Clostridia bacterium]